MNKFKPVLSICIPCYKRINQVRNTLNSIYEANSEISMDDYEVILSDMGHRTKRILRIGRKRYKTY